MRPPRPLLRLSRRWLALAVAAWALGVGVIAPPTGAQPGSAGASVAAQRSDAGIESQFVSRINSLRASKGLNQLTVDGQLQGVARRWTDRMVAAGQISHNPNLASEVSGGWTKLGENVGVGYDVDGLMQAFINSPAHYKNLVDPEWTHLGVGATVSADGRIYTTHNFMALPGGGPAPAPPPPEPEPTPERVTAVLDPLRSLEAE